jgi:hypothetical protein
MSDCNGVLLYKETLGLSTLADKSVLTTGAFEQLIVDVAKDLLVVS